MTDESDELHPVSSAMRASILEQLSMLEELHEVVILLAVESGSRGWGFSSPDSDYDVRFIYIRPQDSYLSLTPERDVLEVPISNELDISGWDLKKALTLLAKGNVTPAEWLNSPISYRRDEAFAEQFGKIIALTHRSDRAFRHYFSLAKLQSYQAADSSVRLKRFLYTLRSLLAARWVQRFDSVAPMRLVELADEIVTEPGLRSAITKTVDLKRSALESKIVRVPQELIDFVEWETRELAEVSFERTAPVEEGPLNDFFRNSIRN